MHHPRIAAHWGWMRRVVQLFAWGPPNSIYNPFSSSWLPVFRHVGSSGMWPASDVWTMNNNSQNPSSVAQYLILKRLANYRSADGIVFKVRCVWPMAPSQPRADVAFFLTGDGLELITHS